MLDFQILNNFKVIKKIQVLFKADDISYRLCFLNVGI